MELRSNMLDVEVDKYDCSGNVNDWYHRIILQ